MIDLTPTITQAQIAFALGIIAMAMAYYVLNKYPLKAKRKLTPRS